MGRDPSRASQMLGPREPWAAQRDCAPSYGRGLGVPEALGQGLSGEQPGFIAVQVSKQVEPGSWQSSPLSGAECRDP